VFDRVLGKPRESVSLDFTGGGDALPWQKLMAESIVSSVEDAGLMLERQRAAAAAAEDEEIVDAEIVEEDTDDDDE